MMQNKPVAIVLGGTNPHKALMEKLKDRGFFVILVDYFDNPPAKEVTNIHIKESTLDKEAVLEIAKKYNAKLVISSCVDQAYITACYVGEILNLPIPFSYKAALEFSNKIFIKQKMTDNNIPTAKFIVLDTFDKNKINNLSFPLVVKPVDTNGSKGVRKVEKKDDIEDAFKMAQNVSNKKEIIIEEFLDGVELGVDCVVINNVAKILTTHQKRKPSTNDNSVIFSIGSLSPAQISSKAQNKIELIATQIAKCFDLNNTPLLIQCIVKNDDVNVVEFAPRIGGGLNFFKIKLFANYDILEASIDSFLNIPLKSESNHPSIMYSENHIYTEPGIFGKISGYEKYLTNNILEIMSINKTRGMKIEAGKASKDRIASFVVKGKDINEIEEKTREVIDHLIIQDIDGKKLPFHHLYENLMF